MDYPSIHRVPQRVKNVNSEAYCPQHVSFGPYHHGKEHLKSMEEHKVRALDRFLNRLSRTDDQLMEALSKAPVDLMMACYDQLDQKWYDDREAFLRLMIRDGCFMLEILRTWMEIQTANEDAPDDPIFSSHGKVYVMPYVKRDMLMLENQLPMSVLDELVAVESHGSRSEVRPN